MKIRLLVIGKTSATYLEEGISVYSDRLDHYCDFTIEVISDIKNARSLDNSKLMKLESMEFLKRIKPGDITVLLDENGKQFSSDGFAKQLDKWAQTGNKNLFFIIGGAFGADEVLKERADFRLSLSSMTFSHQMVRMIFLEQLYRAFTILKNEKYHHR